MIVKPDYLLCVDVGNINFLLIKELMSDGLTRKEAVINKNKHINRLVKITLESNLGYVLSNNNNSVCKGDIDDKYYIDLLWSKLLVNISVNEVYFMETMLVNNKLYVKLEEMF